ncbi:MAG: methanogenesis marker protein Mmp4/MtxX [Candidatus Helarchaeota archaeon]
MKIIEKIKSLALKKYNRIAIGISPDEIYIDRIKQVIKYFNQLEQFKIILVSKLKINISDLSMGKNIELIISNNPSFKMIQLLLENRVDGIVRGTLSSSNFLKEVKKNFMLNKISRIALLEDTKGRDFFFAPVGIDEGRTFEEKAFFIEQGYEILKKFGFNPSIAILSGGRLGDIGRDKYIDETIKIAEKLVEKMKNKGLQYIFHSEILIEKAIEKSNYLIAPDGISGNLVYRTLVHLGNGLSHGAIYIEPLFQSKIIIDTSRVGPVNEYISAIMLAAASQILI